MDNATTMTDLHKFDLMNQRKLLFLYGGQHVDRLPQDVFLGQRGVTQQW